MCTTSHWMVDWDRNRTHCSTDPTREVQIIMRAPCSIPMLLNIFIEYHGYYVDVLRIPSPFQSHLVWAPLRDHGGWNRCITKECSRPIALNADTPNIFPWGIELHNSRCAHSLTGAIPPQVKLDITGITNSVLYSSHPPPKAENRQHLSSFLSYNPCGAHADAGNWGFGVYWFVFAQTTQLYFTLRRSKTYELLSVL